jgi:GTP-binding protein
MKTPEVSFVGSAASPECFPRDGLPEVAFLGRSNVGKSSLLNALAGKRAVARVSNTPGRTRLVNFFRVDDELYFADLPGYGYAKAPKHERERWEELVRSYIEGRHQLALCVFLVDSRHDPMPRDEMLRGYLDDLDLVYVVASTKADKLGRGALSRRQAGLRNGLAARATDVVAVSARTGHGIRDLWKVIRAVVSQHPEN